MIRDFLHDPVRSLIFASLFFYGGLVLGVGQRYVGDLLFRGGWRSTPARHVTALAFSTVFLLGALAVTLFENLGTGFHVRLVLIPLGVCSGIYGLTSLIYRLPRG